MKALYNTFIDDMRNNPVKLFLEVIGSLFFLTSVSLLSYYGDNVDTKLILYLNMMGCLCFFGFSCIIRSASMMVLNAVYVVICLIGFFNKG